MLTGFASDGNPTFDDLRMVDRDVILVRRDVATSNPAAAAYATNVSETIGGNELEFTRGWVAVDVDVCGETYRFVNTHLEIKSAPNSIFRVVQAAQMYELLTILSYETKPIILVGDINSSPEDVPGCYPSIEACIPGYEYYPPYMQAMTAGYLDAWDRLFSPMEGFTSDFSETVDDPSDALTERIDHILLRLNGQDDKWFAGITTGDNVFFMTPNGFWPSDHAGVVIKVLSNSADN
jgi:hypothetical protein